MQVLIPSALRSYTGRLWAQAQGETVDAVLHDLNRQYPGFRFRLVDEQDRLRANMRLFVNGLAVEDLNRRLQPNDELAIVQALSGG
jgi:molybdopterin converting factor small subunit